MSESTVLNTTDGDNIWRVFLFLARRTCIPLVCFESRSNYLVRVVTWQSLVLLTGHACKDPTSFVLRVAFLIISIFQLDYCFWLLEWSGCTLAREAERFSPINKDFNLRSRVVKCGRASKSTSLSYTVITVTDSSSV